MSYHRKGRRRVVALSGLASRAPGRSVASSALTPPRGFGASAIEYDYGGSVRPIEKAPPSPPPVKLVAGRRMVPRGQRYVLGAPDWYEKMQGLGSLGDDTLAATTVQQQQLEAQQQTLAAIQKQAEGDRFQKWIQIGVTASIPVFGALWRALGIGRRRK